MQSTGANQNHRRTERTGTIMKNSSIECEIIEITALMKEPESNYIKEVNIAFWGSCRPMYFAYVKNITTGERIEAGLTNEERKVLLEKLNGAMNKVRGKERSDDRER